MALLQNVGVSEPVILVGHSAGGMFIRVFAHAYPAMVRALVLVDPITEDVYDHMRVVDSLRWAGYEGEAATWPAPEGWYGQWRALPVSIAEARMSWPLPDVPVVLFTAMSPLEGEWPIDTPEHMELWGRANAALALSIGEVDHTILPAADHLSVLEEPAVLEAIVRLVSEGRKP